MSIRVFVFVALFCLSGTASASSHARVVELAVFSCPYCMKFQQDSAGMKQKLGDGFIFAPVATNPATDYVIQAYYALRDRVDHRRLAAVLFDLIQHLRMQPQTPGDVLQWLHFKGIDFDTKRARKAMHSQAVNAAMNRARRLASMAGVRVVPSLVLVDEGHVVGTWHGGKNTPNSELIKTVINAWERQHEHH